jgi:hypothetical protein
MSSLEELIVFKGGNDTIHAMTSHGQLSVFSGGYALEL